MTARERLDERPAAQRAGAGQLQVKPVTLALQGGGAHGAFAWGCSTACWRTGALTSRGSAPPAPGR
ncbi:hypothetical protein ACFSHR_02930 [Azotobacter chroococcum]